MDEMKGNFEDDFKSYNKLMEEVAKKPIVSKCCLMPERKSMLDEYKSKFLQHKMACKALIELKQRSLPRLTFLSDQVIENFDQNVRQFKFFLKWATPGLFFIYFRSYNTIFYNKSM